MITLIAGGCLTVLFTSLCMLVLIVGRNQIAVLNGPTPTPTLTPVPRILVHSPSDQSKVIHEDFSSNKNLWALYYDPGKLEVVNGKMILQSNVANNYEIGTSRTLAPNGGRYYIQADLSTDTETSDPYGLLFGSSRSLGTYYMFEIQPQRGTYRLSKYNAGHWKELIPATSVELNPHPFSNTLSVYFDHGKMELYINGSLASTYTDKDFFQSRDLGMFVSNTGYRLLVDDLFLYSEK